MKEILIYKFQEGVFYSKLICEKDGQQTEIDSRTSDAIAIGVRFNAPIYTLGIILDEVGGAENATDDTFDFDEEEEEEEEERGDNDEDDDEKIAVAPAAVDAAWARTIIWWVKGGRT